ncbi:40-kDa huntingtin-associated protein [Lemmus lemmus]
MARCHQALFHGPGGTLALTEAARLFLLQKCNARHCLGCPAAYGEPLQVDASALGSAMYIHLELSQPATAAALCLDLAAALRALGQPEAALGHFQRAAQLHLPLMPLAALQGLGDGASGQLLAHDYTAPQAFFTCMQRLARDHGGHPVQHPELPPSLPPGPQPPQPGPQRRPGLAMTLSLPLLPDQAPGSAASPSGTLGVFADILVRCKVSWVLMLVLLQPSPTKLLPKHAQTLEKYSWEAFDGHGQDSSGQLPEELFLLLQSLVMAAHEKDPEGIKKLQVEMWPLLTAEQNHLLHLVLQEAVSPSGRGSEKSPEPNDLSSWYQFVLSLGTGDGRSCDLASVFFSFLLPP